MLRISCFDPQLRHVFVNPAAARVTGLERSDFVDRTNREIGMPEHLAEQWDRIIRDAFLTGQVGRERFEYETPNGPRTFDALIIPERDPSARAVQRVWGWVRDITDAIDGSAASDGPAEVDASLPRAPGGAIAGAHPLRRFEYLVEATTDAIVCFDADGRSVFLNSRPSAQPGVDHWPLVDVGGRPVSRGSAW